MRFVALRRSFEPLRRLRVRLGLSVAAALALATGLALLCFTTVVFGGVSEDVTQHNGLFTSDLPHLRWFTMHRSDVLVSVARVLSDIGSVAILGFVAVVAGVVLWRRGLRLVVAAAPGIALGVAGVCAAVGKSAVARGRPPVALHLVSETNASFPSGHATDSSALYVTLALIVAVYVLRRPLARCVCVLGSGLVVGAIGISRLVLGVHWPTDVVAGWALGASVALAVTIAVSLAVRLAPQGPPSRPRGHLGRVLRLLMRERRTPGVLEAAL
jgi:undecaprenyl-diphosphatase